MWLLMVPSCGILHSCRPGHWGRCSGLPVSVNAQVPASVPKKSGGSPSSEKVEQYHKFSMGVTLPTVPPWLVKQILSGKFVDMVELSQDALHKEFKRGSKGEDQKVSSRPTFRPVADRDALVARFAQLAGVVCRSHPEKAVALWGHLAVIVCPARIGFNYGSATCVSATANMQSAIPA